MPWISLVVLSALASEPDPFRWEAGGGAVAPGDVIRVPLTLRVPEGHAVYRDRVKASCVPSGGLTVTNVDVPLGEPRPDPAGEGIRPQLVSDAVVQLHVRADSAAMPGLVTLQCTATHQGCRAGLCWPEVNTQVSANVAVLAPKEPGR